MEQIKSYPYCFGCGDENPIGLRLKYRKEGDQLVTDFLPREVHQGWPDILHGGIITSLLYEVMENFPYQQEGLIAMMRGMNTSFRGPGHTNSRITARSWLVERNDREMKVAASLTNDKDRIIAEGNADLIILRDDQIQRMGL